MREFLNSKFVGFILFCLVFIPSLIGYLITEPKWLFGHTSADANAWLGFWGSFLGGIIGTLAVILVAYLQNNHQLKLLKIQNKEQRILNDQVINLEKQKLKNEVLMNILQEIQSYNEKLTEISVNYTITGNILLNGNGKKSRKSSEEIFFDLLQKEEKNKLEANSILHRTIKKYSTLDEGELELEVLNFTSGFYIYYDENKLSKEELDKLHTILQNEIKSAMEKGLYAESLIILKIKELYK
ncbi:hypothetical protein [Macrococcoides canis]|uniref:Uncharacterized protein n=1 Tax=Macrococcoides canis TaxID=1855823 RepID=A0A1W7A8R1_9STAP|nr:hypothetical protein [Macrococcus canis]ARQ06025.1 hypothetical protein MCCS_03570 [Macrococcus canis]